MSATMERGGIVLGLVLVLLVLGVAVAQKEALREGGEVLLLELAPVDPRSLMAGAYMDLRYTLHMALEANPPEANDGYIVVRKGADGVCTFLRYEGGEPLKESERKLRYRRRAGRMTIGPNAFYFQEGHAKRFEQARYGAFRVSSEGELLLVGLHDAERVPIEPGPPAP